MVGEVALGSRWLSLITCPISSSVICFCSGPRGSTNVSNDEEVGKPPDEKSVALKLDLSSSTCITVRIFRQGNYMNEMPTDYELEIRLIAFFKLMRVFVIRAHEPIRGQLHNPKRAFLHLHLRIIEGFEVNFSFRQARQCLDDLIQLLGSLIGQHSCYVCSRWCIGSRLIVSQ